MKLNLTPIIDVVFLLIIFLIIVYQKIDAENHPLDLPYDCNQAQEITQADAAAVLSVFADRETGKINYAIAGEITDDLPSEKLQKWLAEQINAQITSKKTSKLRLRIDKDIPYKYAQQAIIAAAKSNAQQMEFAAKTDDRP